MGNVNRGFVVAGGLAAGVVINAIEWLLNGVILAQRWEAVTKVLGKQMGGSALVLFTAWGFLIGIFAVWLYAAIRPRYGAGPKTAVLAAFAVWVGGYLLASVTPLALNLFPADMMVIGLAAGLVEIVLATLLGAWIYRDASAATQARVAAGA